MLRPRISKSALPIGIRRKKPIRRPGDSQKHIDWLKTLPSIISGIEPCGDAHHLLRLTDENGRKDIKGTARKHEDRWALPVTRGEHDVIHDRGDDEAYFAELGIPAREVCSALWRISGDTAAALRIIYMYRPVLT